MTHSYVWHDAFRCATRLVHMSDLTHPHVWHDSFICETRLIHTCDMTRTYAWHSIRFVTRRAVRTNSQKRPTHSQKRLIKFTKRTSALSKERPANSQRDKFCSLSDSWRDGPHYHTTRQNLVRRFGGKWAPERLQEWRWDYLSVRMRLVKVCTKMSIFCLMYNIVCIL